MIDLTTKRTFALDADRVASGRLAAGALVTSMMLAVAAPLGATGPNPTIGLLPLSPSSGGVPGPIQLVLHGEGVQEIDVQSRIVSGAGVGAAQTVGLSILDPLAVSAATRANPPAGHAVAGKGDTVQLPSPHLTTLPPGVYVEKLLITIVLGGAPVDLSDARFFEVTASGSVVPLSSTEYSARVERFMTLLDGRRVRIGAGIVGKPARPMPVQQAVRIAEP